MNIPTKTLLAAGRYLLNKAFAIALLVLLMVIFHSLPADRPVAFSELLYLSILIIGIAVVAPLLRLLVFPEAAEYAESPKLRGDLAMSSRTPALLHYWFATAISYVATIACFATLAH